MKIIPLTEGSFTVDASKQFIPFDKEVNVLKDRPLGSLLVEIQPFAVVTNKDILLFDTGLGFAHSDGTLQIHQHLLNHGIHPEKVTKVLLSHLHKDHSGGVATTNKKSLSFPQATYYINEKEFALAMQKSNSSYRSNDFAVLENAKNLVFTDGDGAIDDSITYQLSGGHCPYHQVFWVKENGETIFYGGDVAPQLIQMKTKFVAKYDFDGKKSSALRQQWWQQGEEERWTFLFYHDIKTPIFQFNK